MRQGRLEGWEGKPGVEPLTIPNNTLTRADFTQDDLQKEKLLKRRKVRKP